MRFPRQASMASRLPLSPLPTNPSASDELTRTRQVAAKETRKRSASVVDLETCVARNAPVAEKSHPGAGESTAAAICKRNDGRGWRCKNAAAEGSSLCGHHLARYAARTSHGSAAASGAKGSRCRRGGGGGGACADDNSTANKKTATKAQKCAEKINTHEKEKVTAMDPEVYNAAYILYHIISEFSTESHAADVMLAEEMNGGDDDDDDDDNEKEDDGMEAAAAATAVAMHGHEGFLALN